MATTLPTMEAVEETSPIAHLAAHLAAPVLLARQTNALLAGQALTLLPQAAAVSLVPLPA